MSPRKPPIVRKAPSTKRQEFQSSTKASVGTRQKIQRNAVTKRSSRQKDVLVITSTTKTTPKSDQETTLNSTRKTSEETASPIDADKMHNAYGDGLATTERRTARAMTLRSSTVRTCTICAESLLYDDFPTKSPTASCTHPITTCTSCLATHISISFATRLFDQIQCPQCPALLSATDIARHADITVARRYADLVNRVQVCRATKGCERLIPYIFGKDTVVKCGKNSVPGPEKPRSKRRPTRSISTRARRARALAAVRRKSERLTAAAAANDDAKAKEKASSKGTGMGNGCGGLTCTTCDAPSHPTQSCTEAQRDRDTEVATRKSKAQDRYLRTKTVICPGGDCGVHIQRSEGCNSMMCSKCRQVFCYRCRGVPKDKGSWYILHQWPCYVQPPVVPPPPVQVPVVPVQEGAA